MVIFYSEENVASDAGAANIGVFVDVPSAIPPVGKNFATTDQLAIDLHLAIPMGPTVVHVIPVRSAAIAQEVFSAVAEVKKPQIERPKDGANYDQADEDFAIVDNLCNYCSHGDDAA